MSGPSDESPSLTLDASGVATMLGMSKATVMAWAKANRVPAYRVGRSWIWLRAELVAWVESTSTAPRPDTGASVDPLAGLPPLLTTNDVAQLLLVSPATVAGFMSTGALASLDLGTTARIPRAALREFLSTARNGAARVGDDAHAPL